jgi:hypothetical protein
MLTVLLATLCTSALATEPRVVEVVLNNYTIKPDMLILKAGEPVILKVKNAATFIPHNLVVQAAMNCSAIHNHLLASRTRKGACTACW